MSRYLLSVAILFSGEIAANDLCNVLLGRLGSADKVTGSDVVNAVVELGKQDKMQAPTGIQPRFYNRFLVPVSSQDRRTLHEEAYDAENLRFGLRLPEAGKNIWKQMTVEQRREAALALRDAFRKGKYHYAIASHEGASERAGQQRAEAETSMKQAMELLFPTEGRGNSGANDLQQLIAGAAAKRHTASETPFQSIDAARGVRITGGNPFREDAFSPRLITHAANERELVGICNFANCALGGQLGELGVPARDLRIVSGENARGEGHLWVEIRLASDREWIEIDGTPSEGRSLSTTSNRESFPLNHREDPDFLRPKSTVEDILNEGVGEFLPSEGDPP